MQSSVMQSKWLNLSGPELPIENGNSKGASLRSDVVAVGIKLVNLWRNDEERLAPRQCLKKHSLFILPG